MDLNKTTVCSVALPSEAAREARVVAAMEGTSRSALMRKLLLEYLNDREANRTRSSWIMASVGETFSDAGEE